MRLTLLYELIDVSSRCLNRCEKLLLQLLYQNCLFPVWVFLCIFKLDGQENATLQFSQKNWFPSLDEISHVFSSHLNMCSIFHMLHNCMISLQCVLSCTFKSFICDQVLSHCMQQSGYSSVWIFFWLFMWPDYEKDMTQVLYLNDFSPVWVLLCVPNLIAFAKHFWHIISFSIVWAISCLLDIPDVEKFLSQLMPLNAFSPVWIISWIFKAFVFEKVLTLCAPT